MWIYLRQKKEKKYYRHQAKVASSLAHNCNCAMFLLIIKATVTLQHVEEDLICQQDDIDINMDHQMPTMRTPINLVYQESSLIQQPY